MHAQALLEQALLAQAASADQLSSFMLLVTGMLLEAGHHASAGAAAVHHLTLNSSACLLQPNRCALVVRTELCLLCTQRRCQNS